MNGVIKQNQVTNIKAQNRKTKRTTKVANKRGNLKKTEVFKALICLKILKQPYRI